MYQFGNRVDFVNDTGEKIKGIIRQVKNNKNKLFPQIHLLVELDDGGYYLAIVRKNAGLYKRKK